MQMAQSMRAGLSVALSVALPLVRLAKSSNGFDGGRLLTQFLVNGAPNDLSGAWRCVQGLLALEQLKCMVGT